MNELNQLKELTLHPAVSGLEERTAEVIADFFKIYCDVVEIDRFFNVIGIKKGTDSGKKVLVTAHYDEIGFLVKSIDENGFIKLSAVGGVDSKILLAEEVTVHGTEELYGVIGAKPPHLLKPEETKKAVKLEDLYVDIGMKKEKASRLVPLGSMVTLRSKTSSLGEGKVVGKSLDNRASILAILQILESLKNIQTEAELYFVATTQEELEAAGAKISVYNINPDVAIVLDTCHGESPEMGKSEAFTLGKGPAIGIGPNMHRKLSNHIIDLAKSEKILYQIDVEPGDSGTEAWVIQVSRVGIPTALVSIPVKYMHTAIETVHLEDVRNTGRLVSKFLLSLEKEGGKGF